MNVEKQIDLNFQEKLLDSSQSSLYIKESKGKEGLIHCSALNMKRQTEEAEDDVLYCFECCEEYVGECTTHKSRWILNKRILCQFSLLEDVGVFDEYYNEKLQTTECFCKSNYIKHIKTTLPNGFFLVKSQVANTTYGVWTKNNIALGTILGPFLGKLTGETVVPCIPNETNEDGVYDFVWLLVRTNNVGSYNIVDARNCFTANYLRFIRRSKSETEANLIPFQFDGKIFYQAFKGIKCNEELLVHYAVRTFHPKHHQQSILMRSIPAKGLSNINSLQKSFQENSFSKFWSNKPSISSDIEDDPLVPTSKSLNTYFYNRRSPGSHLNVDDNVDNEEIPQKTNRSICDKPILLTEEAHDEEVVQKIVSMFNQDSSMTYQRAKVQINELYPNKPKLSCENIERILSAKDIQPPRLRRKLDDEMLDELNNLLNKDPWICTKELNVSLQKAFPDKPKVSTEYLSQVVNRRKLRPIRNPRRKIDDEMKKYVIDLYYRGNFTCAQIACKLNEDHPDRSKISERCVSRCIAMHKTEFYIDGI